jgi:hypothetical protein
MANHGNFDNVSATDTVKPGPGNDTKPDGLSALQADAGVFGPTGGKGPAGDKNAAGAAQTAHKDHYREDYQPNVNMPLDQFIKNEPAHLRQHYGLDAKADSQTLLDRMSHDSFKIYKGSSPDMKTYVNEELGLPKGKSVSEEQFVKAQQDSWRKSVGLDGHASAEQVEAARNKQTYVDFHKPLKDLKQDPN